MVSLDEFVFFVESCLSYIIVLVCQLLTFLGEMQRIAFRFMLPSCVSVCVCAAFVDFRKTV